MKATVFLFGAGLLAALGFAFYKLSRFDAEEVPYEVRRNDGRFELRNYPALAVARTAMRPDRNDSFQRLFDFISGANDRQEKIAMTVPVLFEREPEMMSFFMPEATKRRGVPQPRTGEIELGQRPPADVAAVRFRGGMKETGERRAIAELREWIRAQHLEPEGEPIIAYYDSPFIPGPLRRNEAMWRVARR